jgi:hypothetical protein
MSKLTVIVLTLIILTSIILIFALRIGGIKHQIKFYVRNYAKFRKTGLSREQATIRLVEFYLRSEPTWKAEIMKAKVNVYIKNFDELIYDIMLFYYHSDPRDKVWKVDILASPAPPDFILMKADKFLVKYKKKYFLNFPEDSPGNDKR